MIRLKRHVHMLVCIGAMLTGRVANAAEPGLAAWWQLTEGVGRIAADSSGNGYDARLINQPRWVLDGSNRHALSFSGRTYLTVKDAPGLDNLQATGLTVAAWIRPVTPGGGGRGRILDKEGWFFATYVDSIPQVQLQFACGDSGGYVLSKPGAITLNAWQHVAATWDGHGSGAGMHLYVNGILVDGSFVAGTGEPGDDAASSLDIGNRSRGQFPRGFDGQMADIRVYNRVLSTNEILQLAHRDTSARAALSH